MLPSYFYIKTGTLTLKFACKFCFIIPTAVVSSDISTTVSTNVAYVTTAATYLTNDDDDECDEYDEYDDDDDDDDIGNVHR